MENPPEEPGMENEIRRIADTIRGFAMGCALNDIRAILGNDIAIKTCREGKLPFPEGAIITQITWNYDPS